MSKWLIVEPTRGATREIPIETDDPEAALAKAFSSEWEEYQDCLTDNERSVVDFKEWLESCSYRVIFVH